MFFAKQIEALYKKQLFSRCDDTGTVFYFDADHFAGLKKSPYAFKSSLGYDLQGYFYSYEAPIEGRIVVFDHGMGGGHRAYMKEIEMLARKGYLVFSYDHSGCMESQGTSTNGFAQSLHDLNDCLKALKEDPLYKNMDISIMGHSWGAFASMNITALHPDVSHIVAMSGFISVKQMLKQTFGGIMSVFQKHIYQIEKQANPQYVEYCAQDSLANTNAQVLLIYSMDDNVVKRKFHFDVLKNALSHKENIHFLQQENKGHNPNYTKDALSYKDMFFATLTAKQKKNKLTTPQEKQAFVAGFDWERMTKQDESVWEEIFKLLEA